jgi:hypothetical protein
MRLPTAHKEDSDLCCAFFVHHNCLVVSPSSDQINLDTSDAGSLGRNSLEILIVPDSLVRPIRFVYLTLIKFTGVHLSLAPVPYN